MQNVQNFKVAQLERELAHLLMIISQKESYIEESRINLAENDKFNAEDAFEKLDQNNHGYLLISDFLKFFSQNHMPVLERECYYIFNYYCNESGKQMEFNDFLKLITPVTNLELRDRFLRRAATRKRKMPFFLVDQLAQLIQKELDFFLKTETMKMNLMHAYGWNALKAFSLIDRMAKGYIDYHDVAKLMEKIGEPFSEDDYRALARRLDRDFNERLTKNEFCDALLPNDVSREDVELKKAAFIEKSPDFFYNPSKTIKIDENQITQKRKFLNQNVNLINQDYDNVFSGNREEELIHIKPYLRSQEDVMAFASENFYKQRITQPISKPKETTETYEQIRPENYPKKIDQSRVLYKSQNLNNSQIKSSRNKIFEKSLSPLKRSADLLKQSLHDFNNNLEQRNSNMSQQRNSTYTQKSKLGHLFEKVK